MCGFVFGIGETVFLFAFVEVESMHARKPRATHSPGKEIGTTLKGQDGKPGTKQPGGLHTPLRISHGLFPIPASSPRLTAGVDGRKLLFFLYFLTSTTSSVWK